MYPHFEIIIPAYALFTCIGLFFMMLAIYYRSKKLQISFESFLLLMGILAAGAVLGSKCLFIITQIPQIIDNFSIHKTIVIIIRSGFVFYGGLFGAIFGAWLFARYNHFKVQDLMNVITPGFAIFHVFGRMGCFFGGCCYGKIATRGIALYDEPGVLRIPIQLIESGCILLIFIVLLYIDKKIKNISLLSVYLAMYAICRFVLEFFRGDAIRGIWWGISTSQIISLLILLALLIRFIFKRKPMKKNL